VEDTLSGDIGKRKYSTVKLAMKKRLKTVVIFKAIEQLGFSKRSEQNPTHHYLCSYDP